MTTTKGKPDPNKDLTRAEEQVMQHLWEIKEGLVHDILNRFPDPKPAYTTVSTILRILEQKGFVGHRAYGRTHVYFPRLDKKAYTRHSFKNLFSNYFGNSYQSLASFFTEEGKLSVRELEEIQAMIQEQIRKQKERNHEN